MNVFILIIVSVTNVLVMCKHRYIQIKPSTFPLSFFAMIWIAVFSLEEANVVTHLIIL